VARLGQVIEGAHGVRATVTATPTDTAGRAFEFEFVYPSGTGNRVGAHLHTRQTESFEVVDGRVRYVLDGQENEAGAGDRVVVPPGVAHVNPWNVGAGDARIRQRVEPALDFDVVIETLLGLARDGKLGPGGQVPFLALAALGDGIASKSYRPGPPIPVQAAVFKIARWIGWPFGYRARYERYSGPAAATS
jgi:mannose-6-phosphate isomerase-like protein (cupin superfamily)